MNLNEALSLLKGGEMGVSEWNQRRSNGEPIPSLEGVDLASHPTAIVTLKKADLREANLQKANLSNTFMMAANLSNAKLAGATLQMTNLTEVNLTGADLRGADLTGAILARAKIADANLRDANLQDADLQNMKGFYGSQLAGASVSGAKLPDEIKSFAALGTIEKACTDARTIFVAMLLGCVYTVLTIGTTTDSVLITNSSSTPLPIIATQIPVVGFYVVAPLILFGFYLYFHLCMQNIWERLGTLPAVLQDGRYVDKAADPWLVLGLLRSHFTQLGGEQTFLSYVQAFVSLLLMWYTVPLTLFLLWVRYLKAHDWLWATEHVLLFVTSVTVSLYTYRRAVSALTTGRQVPFSFKHTRGSIHLGGVAVTVLLLLLCSVVIYESIQGHIWNADLENADVSTKPAGWTGDPSKEDSEIRQVKPATLAAANLRNARANRAFLVRADLRHADLSGANLMEADLRGADLTRATLAGAILLNADLRRADLTSANLEGAHFGNNFYPTGKYGADLQGAKIVDANLKWADLYGVNLKDADLRKADLRNADLRGAHLDKTNLADANLEAANLRGAELRIAHGLTNEQIKAALTDEKTKLPAYLKVSSQRKTTLKRKSEVKP